MTTPYTGGDRPGEAVRRVARVAAAAAIAVGLSGCSFALPSFMAGDEEATGSLAPKAISPLSPALGQEDWRRAKAALAVALDPRGNGSAVTWDNPETGLKGAFTPTAQPFVRNDEICRAFLATLARAEPLATLRGTACRVAPEEWDIKDVTSSRKRT